MPEPHHRLQTAPFDPARLARRALRRCAILARLSEEPGRLTRTFLSPPMREVHRRVRRWLEAAGMQVRVDAVGNIIGRYPAAREPAPTFLIGSHLDTVPDAGAYDGVLGVMVGIAAVEALGGRRLPFAVEVVGFSEEEGVRFGVPFLGSRALAGRFEPGLLELHDDRGVSVAEAIRDFGLDPERIPECSLAGRPVLGYLEVHIEQGPVLEERGLALAAVETIVGQERADLYFAGQAAHAGTTPMPRRRDALLGAAEFALAAEAEARSTPGLVATVGRIGVEPGAANVIPGICQISLDLRHARDAVRREAAARLRDAATDIAARRRLDWTWQTIYDQPAVDLDPRLTGLLLEAMAAAGHPPERLVSGAGHDAMIMAGVVPSAMLFIRTPGGLSHHPDEHVLPEDVAAAIAVTVALLERLAREAGGGA